MSIDQSKIATFEETLYDEIIEKYQSQIGVDLRTDPHIYHEIIRFMQVLKEDFQDDKPALKEVVANAILLILSLYFNDDDKDPDGEKGLTKLQQSRICEMLKDVLKTPTSQGTA